MVPVHNEEGDIQSKLENLAEVSYPKEKMEVILIDDASTDKTLDKVYGFVKNHPELPIKVLRQVQRKGKASALNKGLEVSSSDIIVVTDADVLWPPDVLNMAVPYLSDPTVGAISGLGVAKNPSQSWVTKAETGYLGLMQFLRLGESKVHSTIRFEGCFCAFKKNAFEEFDTKSGADDSGTALQVIQNKFRTILVPEAYMMAEIPYKLEHRIRVKIRRAFHLTGLWFRCLKLLLQGRLKMPKRIAIPEIFISLFDPVVFVALACATFVLVAYYPIVLIPLILFFGAVGLVPRTRGFVVQAILDQFILFYSIVLYAMKRKFVTWEKQ